MKLSHIFAALLFVVLFFGAIELSHANGSPTPAPSTVTGTQGQQQAAQAQAGAAAGAVATGESDADASSYGAGGNVLSRNNSLLLNFPQPVWTHVPGAKGTCIVTNSEAGSVGWSFASKSESKQGSDVPCVLEKMFDSAMANCHFESAELIRNRALRYMQPDLGGLPLTPGVRNLSHAECDALRRPRLAVTPVIAAVPAVQPAPPAAVCPVPAAPVRKPVLAQKRPVLTCPVPLVPVERK